MNFARVWLVELTYDSCVFQVLSFVEKFRVIGYNKILASRRSSVAL
ncbi:MAG: hypothetical protein KGZ71_10400 [Desulfobulbaceae bacterium]|nr:hypothetical protein [Desulfobulbaceae bacterium]